MSNVYLTKIVPWKIKRYQDLSLEKKLDWIKMY